MKTEEKDFKPYGQEWEKEMMKWSKKDLIAQLKKILTDLPKLSDSPRFPE